MKSYSFQSPAQSPAHSNEDLLDESNPFSDDYDISRSTDSSEDEFIPENSSYYNPYFDSSLSHSSNIRDPILSKITSTTSISISSSQSQYASINQNDFNSLSPVETRPYDDKELLFDPFSDHHAAKVEKTAYEINSVINRATQSRIIPPRPDIKKSYSAESSPVRDELIKTTGERQKQPQPQHQQYNIIEKSAPPPIPARPSHALSTLSNSLPTSSHYNDERFASLRAQQEKPVMHTPDSSNSNRRPPLAEDFLNPEINQKGLIRSLAISGNYLCTGQHHIRIYYLPTGENIKTISIEKELNAFSMAFIPTVPEGSLHSKIVWIGIEKGELWALNVETGDILEKKVVHSTTVSHIVQVGSNIWTLDENGALKIWTSGDAKKELSLQDRPKAFRIAAKQQHVILVRNNNLWTAAGRTIEVSDPNSSSDSIIVGRFDVGLSVGNITALAVNPGSSNVYSGHDDGKIIVWNDISRTKVLVVSASIYRITSILGLGGSQIWVGYSTGKIYVYDTPNWKVAKDWEAHKSSAVMAIVADPKQK